MSLLKRCDADAQWGWGLCECGDRLVVKPHVSVVQSVRGIGKLGCRVRVAWCGDVEKLEVEAEKGGYIRKFLRG